MSYDPAAAISPNKADDEGHPEGINGPHLEHYTSYPASDLEEMSKNACGTTSFDAMKMSVSMHGDELRLPVRHLRDLKKAIVFANRLSGFMGGVNGRWGASMEYCGTIHDLEQLSRIVKRVSLMIKDDIEILHDYSRNPEYRIRLTCAQQEAGDDTLKASEEEEEKKTKSAQDTRNGKRQLRMYIHGSEHVFRGKERFRSFYIESGDVTLSRITMQNNGHAKAPSGGAIKVEGSESKVSITKCTFIKCQARNGGAIHIGVDAQVVCRDIVFLSCSALANGGAIANDGYLRLLASTAFQARCGKLGGGVANMDGASAEIKDSEFRQCFASQKGAGIYNANGLILLQDNLYELNSTGQGLSGAAAAFFQLNEKENI